VVAPGAQAQLDHTLAQRSVRMDALSVDRIAWMRTMAKQNPDKKRWFADVLFEVSGKWVNILTFFDGF
jgi:hypothetical protein